MKESQKLLFKMMADPNSKHFKSKVLALVSGGESGERSWSWGVAGEDAADVAVGGVAADVAVVAIEVAAAVEVEVGEPRSVWLGRSDLVLNRHYYFN